MAFSPAMNNLRDDDRPAHDWYRFVLSFPPHLVRSLLERCEVTNDQRVLDPFCGTGTTLVECKKHGIASVGLDAHPLMKFVGTVKCHWGIDPDGLLRHSRQIADVVLDRLRRDGLDDQPSIHVPTGTTDSTVVLRSLDPEQAQLLPRDALSPIPLHKTLLLAEAILHDSSPYRDHQLLALAKVLIRSVSNVRFGPEIGRATPRRDTAVIEPWMHAITSMARDIRCLADRHQTESIVYHADARAVHQVLAPQSIDVVITSPPYPNEKDYTRITRIESVVLGWLRNREALRQLKQSLLRSHSRAACSSDTDETWVHLFPSIQQLADRIEAKRIALRKTSGFERSYARVIRLYFHDIARHLAALRPVLRPPAHLAYVVGDQASYFRILIPTGKLIAEIAQSLGYEVVGIDLFRTRPATTTREHLREEILLLRWSRT